MLIIKKGDLIYAKVDYEKRESFRKIVKGAVWDGAARAWCIPATISTFRNLRQFDPAAMEPTKLSPPIRQWYTELLSRATRLDELQKGIPDELSAESGKHNIEPNDERTSELRGESGDGIPVDTSSDGAGNSVRGTDTRYLGTRVGEGSTGLHAANITRTTGVQCGGCGSDAGHCSCIRPVGASGCSDGGGVSTGTHSHTGRSGFTLTHAHTDNEGNTINETLRQGCVPETPIDRVFPVRTSDTTSCTSESNGRVDSTNDTAPDGGGNSRSKSGSGGPAPIVFPAGFDFHVEPFRHQREAIAFCINLKKSALWLDLGLGKTYTSINVARYRHKFSGVNKVLVVAPRSLLHQWKGEVGKYAPKEADVIIIEGTPSRKRNALENVAKAKGLIFAIVTYESISALRNEISETSFDMFILDEATKIKNPKAARSKATIEVCKDIEYGVELTGLAYLNNPVDLFSQFLALDETVYGTDQWSFSEHYIDFVKAPFGRMMRGLKHVDELKRRAYFIAFSRSKKDCLDLPEKTYITRTLQLFDTQKVWYDKLSAEVLAEVPSVTEDKPIPEVNITNVLTKLEKLQQVTAGFVIKDDGETIWFDSPKYSEVSDIVQESTESFIIWCRHTKAMEYMSKALIQRNIVSETLNRYTSTHKRIQGIKQFKEGKLRVLICQLQSESSGLDLTCKTNSVNAIYLENTFSVNDRFQSEARQHRIGMQGTATYIDLVIEQTIDEHILEVLKGKYNISQYIAVMGLDMVLGKGGSVMTRKTRSKKQMPTPEDHVEFDDESLDGIEGFEDLVEISRRKRGHT